MCLFMGLVALAKLPHQNPTTSSKYSDFDAGALLLFEYFIPLCH